MADDGMLSRWWNDAKQAGWQTILTFFILIINGLVLFSMTKESISVDTSNYIYAYHSILTIYIGIYMIITLYCMALGKANKGMILNYTVLYFLLFINAFTMLSLYSQLNNDLQTFVRIYINIMFLFFSVYIIINIISGHYYFSKNEAKGRSIHCVKAQYWSVILLYMLYASLCLVAWFGASILTVNDFVLQAWIVFVILFLILILWLPFRDGTKWGSAHATRCNVY